MGNHRNYSREEKHTVEMIEALSKDLDAQCADAVDGLTSEDAQTAYVQALQLVENLAHNAREAIIRKRYAYVKTQRHNCGGAQ